MGSTVIAGFVERRGSICLPCRRRSRLSLFRRPAYASYERSLVGVGTGNFGPVNARSGQIAPAEIKVTQAIGMLAGIAPEVTSRMLKPADRVLLCSDGLWEALAEPDIGEIVGRTAP